MKGNIENDNIKLSFIVPVYNVEKYIGQCIDSILNQTMEDFEIIIVDDESTDNSREIVNEYKKRFNNISVYSKKNGGVCSARNYGIKKSRGKFIAFIDSDDFISKDMGANLYLRAIKDNLDIVRCGFNLTNENGEVISSYNNCLDNTNRSVGGYEYIKSIIETKGYTAIIWMAIYKREFIIENGIYFREGVIHEEHEFMLKCMFSSEKCRVAHLNENYYFYRQRMGSAIHTHNLNHVKQIISNAEYMRKFIKENIKSSDEILVANKMMSYLLYQGILIALKLDNEHYLNSRQLFNIDRLKSCYKYSRGIKRKLIIILFIYNSKLLKYVYNNYIN